MPVYSFTNEELYILINKPFKLFSKDKIYINKVTPNIRFKNDILQQQIEICIESESMQTISPDKYFFSVWVDVPHIGN